MVAFNRDLWIADVELAGLVAMIVGAPVAYHVRPDLLVAGAKVMVLVADEVGSQDCVVVGVFGGVPGPDPMLDPDVGHRHRGLVGDGPVVA